MTIPKNINQIVSFQEGAVVSKHIVKAGEMLLIPANSAHSLKALKSFKMILTMIKS